MDVLAWITGVIGLCFVIVYVIFKLDKAHNTVKLGLILLLFTFLLFVGKIMLDDQDYCDFVAVNATVSGATTDFGYDRVCVTNDNTTAPIFYWGSMALWMLFMGYMFVSFIWYWITVILGWTIKNGKIMRMKNKPKK